MPLFNLSNAKDGQDGTDDTRVVFKSSGATFLLNIGTNNEDVQFKLKPRPSDELSDFGIDDEIVIVDSTTQITGLVFNDGDELTIDLDAVTPGDDTRWFFSVSGESALINSDTGTPVWRPDAITATCGTGGCPACTGSAGRILETLVGGWYNLDIRDFVETDQSAIVFDPGLASIDNGFFLAHKKISDFETSIDIVADHEIGLGFQNNSTEYPQLNSWFDDNSGGTETNSDPWWGDEPLNVAILGGEAPAKIYLPPSHGHLGWMFRFQRTFDTPATEEPYFACFELDETTNTLTFIPEDLPAYKVENGALGTGATQSAFIDMAQYVRMRLVPGSGTKVDPYKISLPFQANQVIFDTDGDVDDIVYYELTLNFDDNFGTSSPDSEVFSIVTSPPSGEESIDAATRVKIYGMSDFTVLVGEASGNYGQFDGHTTIWNSAYVDSDVTYFTVEKDGGSPAANEGCRISVNYYRRDFADGDTAWTGQVPYTGSGTSGDPWVLPWEVLTSSFVFAMGSSPAHFKCNIQNDDFSISTSAPSSPATFSYPEGYLLPGDTNIDYYSTDSTFTVLDSSDDDGGNPPPFSKLIANESSPVDIYFRVDPGAGGTSNEDREGYQIFIGTEAAAGAPGGNYTELPDTSTLPGAGTVGNCWQVKWNTVIDKILFSEAGATGNFYFCVEDYTETTQGASHQADSLEVGATRSWEAGGPTLGAEIQSTIELHTAPAFNTFDQGGSQNLSVPYTGQYQQPFDPDEHRIEIVGQTIYTEGDTVYVEIAASEGFSGGYGGSSGADSFQAFFRNVHNSQPTDVSSLSGSGTSGDPYVITYQDFFAVDNLEYDDGDVSGDVHFRITGYSSTGAGTEFQDDTLFFYTTNATDICQCTDTILEYYGNDSTYTTLDSSSDDDLGSSVYSYLEFFGPTGTDHYFIVKEFGGSGVGSGETWRISVGRIPTFFDAIKVT